MYAIRSYYAIALLASLLATTWGAREPITRLIRGDGERGALVRLLAEIWPVLASVYFIAIGVARILEMLSGPIMRSSAAMLSVLLVIALPRITSYNVCYTKLLRIAVGRMASCASCAPFFER